MSTPATVAGQTLYNLGGQLIFRARYSVMTSDQIESLSFNYLSIPTTAQLYDVDFTVATAPTARCSVNMECDYTTANMAAKTINVRWYVEMSGDITGAICDVFLYFLTPGSALQTSP